MLEIILIPIWLILLVLWIIAGFAYMDSRDYDVPFSTAFRVRIRRFLGR